MLAKFVNQRLATNDHAALAGADEFVAAEKDDIRAGLNGFADGRLVRQAEGFQIHQSARAEVIHQYQPPGAGQLRQFAQRNFAGKADNAIIAGVNPHDGRCVFGDGLLVILEVGAVGRAHFNQARAALGHDFGQAKGAADFDKLSARHDNFFMRGQRGEDKEGGGGVIVDDRGGFRPGQFGQDVFHQFVALDPPPDSRSTASVQ